MLNSPTPEIVDAAVAELEYHARLLDAIGTDPSAKIILHVGGLYAGERNRRNGSLLRRRVEAVGAQSGAGSSWRTTIGSSTPKRCCWSRVGSTVPVVFDWLHHHANPCRAPLAEVLPAIFATWRAEDGRPKVHLSSQAASAPRGAHADFIDPADALACFSTLPPQPFDCMLEAKEKDRALLKLRGHLRAHGVVEDDLRGKLVRARR